MTPKEFLRADMMDIMQMSEKEVRKYASAAATILNRRRANIIYNRAASKRAIIESGGERFGIRGKNRRDLLIEVGRMRRFDRSPYSTVAGAKEETRKIEKEWFGEPGEEIYGNTPESLDKLRAAENDAYKAVNDLKIIASEYYQDVINEIDELKNMALDYTMDDLIYNLRDIERRARQKIEEYKGGIPTWFGRDRK